MNSSVINIKIDAKLKNDAQAVASELGFNLSSLIKAYLKSLVQTKTIHFSSPEEEPSEYLLDMLRKSAEDIKSGRISPAFKDAKSAIKWLESKDE